MMWAGRGAPPAQQAWSSRPFKEVKQVHKRHIKAVDDLDSWISYDHVKDALVCQRQWGRVAVGAVGFRIERTEEGITIKPLSAQDMYLKDKIAESATGSVYRCFLPEDNRFFALRHVRCSKEQRKHLVANAVLTMEEAPLEGVAPLLGIYRDKETGDLCLLYPFYEARSVADLLEVTPAPPSRGPLDSSPPSPLSGPGSTRLQAVHLDEAESAAAGGALGDAASEKGGPPKASFDSGAKWTSVPMARLESGSGAGGAGEGRGGKGLEESMVVGIIADVLQGLLSIHGSGQAHRSLCARSVLLDADSGRAVIAGRGLYKALGMYSGQTKVLYTAPELLNRPPVTEEEGMAGDVWALGVIATECLVGKSPFASRDMPSAEWMIRHQSMHLETISASEEMRSFIAACLDRNSATRPKANDLMAHPLMQRYNQMSESVSEYLSAGIRAILPGVGRFGGMQAVQVHNRLYSLAEAGSHDAVLTAQYMFSAEASLTVDRAQFGGSEAAIQQGIVQLTRTRCRDSNLRREVTGVVVQVRAREDDQLQLAEQPAEGGSDMWEATIMWVLTMKPVMGSSAAGYHRAMVMARYRDVMTVDATSAVGDDPSHGAIVTSHVTERLGP